MALNLKKIKEEGGNDGEYTPLTEGMYNLEIQAVEERTAKSGAQALSVTFNVLGPNFKNRKVWSTFSLLEQAQIYLVRFLEAAGLTSLTEQESVTPDEIARSLVGKRVDGYVVMKTNPSTGKTRNDVDRFEAVVSQETSNAPEASTASTAGNPRDRLFG